MCVCVKRPILYNDANFTVQLLSFQTQIFINAADFDSRETNKEANTIVPCNANIRKARAV